MGKDTALSLVKSVPKKEFLKEVKIPKNTQVEDVLLYYGLHKTSTIFSQILFTHLGLSIFFLIITLGSHDQVLLDGATFPLPLIGSNISFGAILVLAPIMICSIWGYLVLYYGHYKKLVAKINSKGLPYPPIITPLKHPILRWLSIFSLYALTPLVLIAMLWKNSGFSNTGVMLWLTIITVTTVHFWAAFYFNCKTKKIKKIANIFAISMFCVVLLSTIQPPSFLINWMKQHPEVFYRKLNLAYAKLHHSILLETNLNYTNIRFADLAGAKLIGAQLKKADLRGANLYKAALNGANLEGANLSNANLQSADLQGANLKGAILTRSSLVDANLKNVNLEKAILIETNGQGADFKRATLKKADLTEASLKEARLSYANVSKACFRDTYLKNTQLDNVDVNLAYEVNLDTM